MRRRNQIVHSDSDEEDGEGMTTTTTPASVSASVASGGVSGSGSVGRPSPPNPSPLPVPFPSLTPSSAPFVISDDDEEVDEIVDPDGDSPIVDAPEVFSPPAPPARNAPAPPPITTPSQTPIPAPPPARTPTPTPTPPAPRTPIPIPTPTPTPPPARTPASTAPPHPSPLSGRLRPVDEFLRRLGLLLRPDWLESCAAGIPGFDGLGGAEAQARRCFEQFLFADMNSCGAGVLPEGVGGMHAEFLDGPFVLQVDEVVNISAPLKERYREAPAGPKRCLKLSITDGVQRIFGMEYRPIKALAVLAPAGLKIIIRNVHTRRGLLMLVPEAVDILGGVVDELEAARDRLVSEVNKPPRGKSKQGGLSLSSRATRAAWPCSTNITNGGEQGISIQRAVNSSYPTGSGNAFQVGGATETVVEELVSPPVVNTVQEINMQGLYASLTRETTETSMHTTHNYDPTHIIERSTGTIMEECVDPPIIANNVHGQMQRVQSANVVEGAQSPNVGKINEMEQSFILSGENEEPFTYIYSMLINWGRQQDTKAYIKGKIKGLITSVKSFQYKQCTKYELYVYIDDGSFISEAFIDSDIVNNMLGLSPGEVTAALSGELEFASPSEVKETLKRFQRFLVKFEGMMAIELNKNSSIPVVRELNESCSSSTAWHLLRRLKTVSYQKRAQSLDIMDTTP
ncbi:LOW QUALITY PROTEIN: recQ-mediated genome instability protein 1-like [Miscanthus floridulus]|uniref:LOW QUALITY PROTEIN: recQ-mediated genome instability protein 1-like n=1 Tax=Miscanthus floridulus TaxID=154761 RepID=UPI00345A193E